MPLWRYLYVGVRDFRIVLKDASSGGAGEGGAIIVVFVAVKISPCEDVLVGQ